jgi:asparagine synthase (glutamine-hydrolysing)
MCGITGILSLEDGTPIPRPVLEEMNRVITHRGPDEDGFHVEPGRVGLAMRRLKIIDLKTGQQPIANEDGTAWVIFNGEIYNFVELRQELETRGHRFRTRSDTEVIIHAYEEYGPRCVERLRGMFTIAIWDATRRRLVLARDRVGVKQLFFTTAGGQLLWGSELKCLLVHPAIERRLSPAGLNHFLTFLYVPAPLTIFDGIEELEPGHLLVVENGVIHRERYWELAYEVDERRPEADAIAGFRELLDESVRMRMVADVPLGAFLSGGIDSGAVVALMSRHATGPVKTFSIGYEDGGELFDERPFAGAVAEQYGTEHHEFVVRPDLEALIPDLVRAFDQPFADSSAIPNWYLSQMTREHVTVALSGLGGDEVAAGYERYRGAILAERMRKLPGPIRRLAAEIVNGLPDSRRGSHFVGRLKRFVRTWDLDFDARYLALITAFQREDRAALLAPEMRRAIDLDAPAALYRRTVAPAAAADPLHRALFADLKLYLPGDLLTLTDRMSMAHALEVRVPYLDHRLLEYAATIPSGLKLRGMERKYLLKRAVSDLLPAAVLERRKMGFSVPLTVWFRAELRPFVEDVLSAGQVREAGVFEYSAVRRILDEHFTYRANHDNQIWALLTFMLWHRMVLHGESLASIGPLARQGAGG